MVNYFSNDDANRYILKRLLHDIEIPSEHLGNLSNYLIDTYGQIFDGSPERVRNFNGEKILHAEKTSKKISAFFLKNTVNPELNGLVLSSHVFSDEITADSYSLKQSNLEKLLVLANDYYENLPAEARLNFLKLIQGDRWTLLAWADEDHDEINGVFEIGPMAIQLLLETYSEVALKLQGKSNLDHFDLYGEENVNNFELIVGEVYPDWIELFKKNRHLNRPTSAEELTLENSFYQITTASGSTVQAPIPLALEIWAKKNGLSGLSVDVLANIYGL